MTSFEPVQGWTGWSSVCQSPANETKESMNDADLLRVLTNRGTLKERAAVLAWRRASAENEQRYKALARTLELASLADAQRTPGPPPSAQKVIATATAGDAAIPPSDRAPPAPRRSSWRYGAAAAAAVVLLAVGVSRFLGTSVPAPAFGAREFVTGAEEQATVVLTDGSVVRLASNSRLRLSDADAARHLSLHGRAYFAVAPDDSRPFTVETTSGNVRALGTRFAVDASAENLRLVVIEGQVALSAPDEAEDAHLGPSQMANIVNGRRLRTVEVPDPRAATDWFGSFLAFENTPLRDAVKEIGREYDVEFRISDPTLADQTITAWFADWTLEEVLEVVCIIATAQCAVEDSVVTMTSPSATGNANR